MRHRMTPTFNYEKYRDGEWVLWILREKWHEQLWQLVAPVIEELPISKHPQTLPIRYPNSEDGQPLYLKVFHASSGAGRLKDWCRDSKAVRSMRQGAALAGAGFNVPLTMAAGEKRKYRFLRKAFVLTVGLHGQSLPICLRERYLSGLGTLSLSEKRDALRRLAVEVRRLHQMGFVHGDLVPTNIFLTYGPGKPSKFIFMDNDRTRRYPKWLPQALWRRNLIQLNRIPLPGITLQDRVRFLRYYLDSKNGDNPQRKLLSWLERKTRERRKECDSVDASGGFRQLMRWEDKA